MAEQKTPELWWSPTRGVFRRSPGGFLRVLGESLELRVLDVDELPADAVCLVPAPSEQTYEWQWGIKVHDGSIMPLIHGDTEARARSMQVSSKRGAVAVRRPVGSWETVEEASE